jgi:diphthine-ammonia ligase
VSPPLLLLPGEMVSAGLKVSHLGRSLQEMKPHLSKLARQYGVNVCGEGGEYETLTLDCPLFSHSIVIEEKEVVEVTACELAPVAHLQLKRLRLQPKSPRTAQTFLPPPLLPHSQVSPYEASANSVATVSDSVRGEEWRVWRWAGFDGRGEDVSQQTSHVLTELSSMNPFAPSLPSCTKSPLHTGWLEECGATSRDVALSHLFLSSMEDFPLVNSLYQPFFPSSPPARVCVQVSLPLGALLRLETLIYQPERGEEGDTGRGLVEMHVQSVSGWAPANIGPYSQAVRGGVVVLLAGQIGLDPVSMTLVPSPRQPSLALHHVTSVLEANHAHLTSALCGVCYYTTEEAGWAARMTWTEV